LNPMQTKILQKVSKIYLTNCSVDNKNEKKKGSNTKLPKTS